MNDFIITNEKLIKYRGNETNVTIPDSVTSIGNSAFSRCTGLTSITIPDGVTSIGGYAFSGCTGLTSITIPDSVTSIGRYAFRGCTGLTSVTIPDGVTSIGGYAFYNCTGLTSVTIPDSVTSIGDGAFYGCTGLTSITVSTGNPVYHSTNNCIIETKTKTLISGCKNSVIPSDGSVTSIGKTAFSGCDGLTSVTIPDSVTSIGDRAFESCSDLTNITVSSGNTVYHSTDNCLIETESKTLILGCKSSIIPTDGSVTSIGNEAFYGCTGLTSITIPDSVTSIGGWAFYYCSGLTSLAGIYKAFNINVNGELSCLEYIFRENEWSKEEKNIKLCEKGYHFCTNLFEIFNYYHGKIDKDIAIYECEAGDRILEGNTSKCVANKIKPVKRLYAKDIMRILSGK